jgi:redox-sensitive bicupin YhaK (pirin superfamily)
MSNIQVYPEAVQGKGAFNGGEILENKPLGFPGDRSALRPYSNLFYWAHARAVTDSTIGLHPHQGFEIVSFVLEGEIRHYDTKLKEWRPLHAGDVQIIRAGNGISHSEWMGEGGEMFQIWFDPNLQKTLEQPASYDDYKSAEFPVEKRENGEIKTLVGPGSPFRMDAPGVTVHNIRVDNGNLTLPAEPGKVYSAYVLEGAPTFNGQKLKYKDFIVLRDQETLSIDAVDLPASVFIIGSPDQLDYPTYAQLRRVG